MKFIYVGLGGILGALLRYGMSLQFNPAKITSMPVGTLLCNYLGCFALGWLSNSSKISAFPNVKAALTTGLIGSFTTFSSFSVETVTLLRQGQWKEALVYGLLSLWGGLALAWLGSAVGRRGAVGV